MNRKNSRSGERGSNKDAMWMYGKHAVKAALLNKNREIFRFVLLESCKDFLEECIDSKDFRKSIRPEVVDRDFFSAIFGRDATHQGCAIFAKKLPDVFIEDLLVNETDNRPFVFLDKITDPQNIGSIMRASAVFGARAVVVTEHNSPDLTPSIIKAASGAAEIVPLIRVVNLVHIVNNLKKCGFWCVGLDEKADKKINEISLDGKFIFVIGSEGEGMRRLTREACDFLVQLPSFGEFTTLNAAQAATVSLYEISKQTRIA